MSNSCKIDDQKCAKTDPLGHLAPSHGQTSTPMSRATAERRTKILAQLLDRKHVTVRDLAAGLQVSEATVRRDLRELADRDELSLVHGGATLARGGDYSFQAKSGRAPEAKEVIGELAAELVADGDQIFLDSGTTCFQLATKLHRRQEVSVLAASLRLATELEAPGVRVILLGGQYRPARMDTVGPLAHKALDQLRGYTAFIGADGLSTDFGPSASDIESAHLHQKVVSNAERTVLLVDDTKFAAASLFRITDWEEVSKVVTNSPPSGTWQDFFAQHEIDVIHP